MFVRDSILGRAATSTVQRPVHQQGSKRMPCGDRVSPSFSGLTHQAGNWPGISKSLCCCRQCETILSSSKRQRRIEAWGSPPTSPLPSRFVNSFLKQSPLNTISLFSANTKYCRLVNQSGLKSRPHLGNRRWLRTT